MRYPEFLRENGKVGFIAPSFGCVQEPYATLFQGTLAKLESKGYSYIIGPNCLMEVGQGKSNTPEKCGLEVNDFFINDKSDVIISCGGGETMCEDLPFIDFEGIGKAKAKWYMGYSDNTNLTFLLNTLCDTASIYGPCAAAFGTREEKKHITDAFELLTGKRLRVNNYKFWNLEPKLCGINLEDDAEVFIVDDEDEYGLGTGSCALPVIDDEGKKLIVMPYKQQVFMGGDEASEVSFKGRLIGGCLDCLSNLIGTSFDKVSDFNARYKDDGIIWFMEACDLNVMSIRRALWQMENAGWFQYVKGFLIGRPLHYNDTFGDFDRIEAVKGILGKYNVPIVMDIDLGHLSPAMPVISGAIGHVEAKGNELSIDYELR